VHPDKALSILVVDDEPAIRDSLKAYLERLGVRAVRTAENGQKALEALAQGHYDYVFMDLMMPVMGGMEVLKILSRKGRSTSVIVMTGYPSMERAIDAVRNGASDFLVKPFRLQDIRISMERIHRLHTLKEKNRTLQSELKQKEQVESLNRTLQKKIKEKSILYHIIDSLSKINRPEEIYDFMTDKAVEACGARRSCFLILDPSRSSLLTFAGHDLPGVRPGLQVTASKDPEGRRVLDGQFVRNHIEGRCREPIFLDQTSCHRNLLAVPFRIRDEPFGLLLVAGKRGKGCFGQDDEFLLNFLAERAALNIENMALYDSLKENLFATLGALVSAIEARDLYTQQHSERVTQFAVEIAVELGCKMEDLHRIESGGPLHDIGKIGIDDLVLKKPGNLSFEEFEKIKVHPLIGVNIVAPLGLDEGELSIIRNHHERWDGKGYPDQLTKEEIPFLARILTVADAFDAMSSDRSYRKALPLPVCIQELEKNSGTQFDPAIVQATVSILLSRRNPSNSQE
jgi:response regulator RpfG family c-di-GMP phosphodiesterase